MLKTAYDCFSQQSQSQVNPKHRKWEVMLSLFLDKGNEVFKPQVFKYENELTTQKYTYGTEAVRKLFSEWIDSLEPQDATSSEQSKFNREAGNIFYKMDKEGNAWPVYEQYTNAIFQAPSGSLDVALAHANRAACLMVLKLFQEAYDDCEFALLYGYEEKSVPKLLIRQMHCASALRNKKLLAEAIAKMRKYESRLNKDFKAQFLGFIEELDSLEELKSQAVVEEFKEKAQKVCSSATKGRYVLTDEDIRAHEPIMSEKAFAFVPIFRSDEEKIHSQCVNCALELIIPFPCHDCKRVSFCSLNCQREHEKFHKFECLGLRKELIEEIGIAYLGLRTFLTGFQELRGALSTEKFTTPEKLWTRIFEVAKSDNLRYYDALLLVSNLDKVSPDDMMRYALTASMLVCYLKKVDFFTPLKGSLNWELVCASLLMRHIAQMVCNAHTIVSLGAIKNGRSLCMTGRRVKRGKLHMLQNIEQHFAAIYPRVSLYNHSCVPSYRNKFDKAVCTALADRPIAKGEEIFNCYGPSAKNAFTETRRADLQAQYCFRCECGACSCGNNEEFTKFNKFACQSCHSEFALTYTAFKMILPFPCPKCKVTFDLEWLSEFLELIETDLINKFPRIFQLFQKFNVLLPGPHDMKLPLLCLFLRELFKLFLDKPATALSAETWDSIIEMAEVCLDGYEQKFCVQSLEYLRAATFYVDIMVMNQRPLELKTIGKIRNAMELLPDRVRELFACYLDDYVNL